MAGRWLAGGMTAVAVMLIAGAGLGQTGGAAPAVQSALLRGGIYAGDCASPANEAVTALAPFAQAVGDAGPGSPLTSYTEAAIALTELVATPHAIAVAIGGDPDALLVCGEIPPGTPAMQPLAVALAESNESGLIGLALLIGDAGTGQTEVLVQLTEQPPAPAAHAATSPPAPVDATPVGSSVTPAAETLLPVVAAGSPGGE